MSSPTTPSATLKYDGLEHYSYFHNPFAQANRAPSNLLISAPVSSSLEIAGRRPEAVRIWSHGFAKLSVKGQGTIVARVTAAQELRFIISSESGDGAALFVSATADRIGFWYGAYKSDFTPGDGLSGMTEIPGKNAHLTSAEGFVRPGKTDNHWLSIDRKTGLLKYGRGYVNETQILYQAPLMKFDEKEGVYHWAKPEYKFFEELSEINVSQIGGQLDSNVELITQPLPVVAQTPPLIISGDAVSLDVLAGGLATVPANLPLPCQKLYGNVGGPNIILDTLDFPDFSQAIQRSVNTPGLLGYNLLLKKATEFSTEPDFTGTYLRITFGPDVGDSPGPPYVLEIWPAGHYSPIHDHGDSYAVIKVLHGSIKAFYYDSLEIPVNQRGAPAELKKGDVTWISPKDYQVHKLWNDNTDGTVCCTIQCYTYGSEDLKHYEYFRYLADTDGDGSLDSTKNFPPNSDMLFSEFKREIREEWKARDQ